MTDENRIGTRAWLALGGAVMWPAVLGLTYAILPAAKKGLAGGMILGVAGLGNAVGPLLGGWLTDVATWRLVFFINLPITAFAMLVTAREVPESAEPGAERGIDVPGITLLSGGRWASCTRSTWAGTAGSAGRCVTVLLISAIFFSALLYLPQFLEVVLGFSALRAGAGLLPLMGAFALTSFAAGPLYNRLGPKLVVSAGVAFLAVGIFLLSGLDRGS